MEELLVVDQPELFSGKAFVAQEVLERFKRQEAISISGPGIEITTLFREKSTVSIGEPITLSLEDLLTAQGEKLPPDIQLQRKKYEFYVVQLACSFRAASGCRFYDATFEISLRNPGQDNPTSAPFPIIYDLAPVLVEDELKVSRKYHINPEIKLDLPMIKADVSAIEYEQSSEYLVYQGRVEAYGLQQSEAGWVFKRTKQHEIGQLQRLFVIIRKQKRGKVAMKFGVAGRVEADYTIWANRTISTNIRLPPWEYPA